MTIVCAILAVLLPLGYRQMGLAPMVIIGGSALLAVPAWLRTTYRRPAGHRLIPLYMLTVALLQLHITEEYLAGFPQRMSATFGLDWSEREFLISLALLGMVAWMLAAVGLYYAHPLANYVAWFMFIGPGFMEWTHYVFPLFEGGGYHYFPGMWTAWMPMIPGIIAMRALWRGDFVRDDLTTRGTARHGLRPRHD